MRIAYVYYQIRKPQYFVYCIPHIEIADIVNSLPSVGAGKPLVRECKINPWVPRDDARTELEISILLISLSRLIPGEMAVCGPFN